MACHRRLLFLGSTFIIWESLHAPSLVLLLLAAPPLLLPAAAAALERASERGSDFLERSRLALWGALHASVTSGAGDCCYL
jgi:hypothetical protein